MLTLRSICLSTVAVENQSVFLTLSVYVTLFFHHAKRMRRIILLYVVCLALSYSTLPHTEQNVRKKFIDEKCSFFSTNFLRNISYSKNNSETLL
jgi:hypothetical protein